MGFQTLGDIARQIEAQTISGLKKRLGQEFSDYLCELFAIEQNFQQGALFNKHFSRLLRGYETNVLREIPQVFKLFRKVLANSLTQTVLK